MTDTLLDFLVCPQTGSPLTLQEGELFTQSTSYPLFNGVPWLFKNPEFSFFEWATKISTHIKEESRYLGYLRLLIAQETSSKRKQRYERILQAKTHNLQYEQDLLGVFLNQQSVNLQPSQQQIHSYFKQIFRDWCWGEEENGVYIDYIARSVKNDPKKIVVLGSGAGRLSQLIAQHFSASQVYSIDHNPFLTFTAQKIFSGEQVELYDYSFFPVSLDKTNHRYSIASSTVNQTQPPLENHQLLLGSFPNLPFAEQSVDLIIAPWFYDILDDGIRSAVESTLPYLKESSTLIQIGPSNVHHTDLDKQYCSEEIVEVYEALFSTVQYESRSVDYLANPIESSGRKEHLLLLTASDLSRSKVTPMPKSPNAQTHGQLILTPELASYKEMITIKSTILNFIEGDMSLEQLSNKIEKAFGLKPSEAEFYAKSFVTTLKQELRH